jgi:NADPH-ferrihemoprotein reductase
LPFQDDLKSENFVIFCVATYGEGEPTDNARQFYEWLSSSDRENNELNGVKFTVFGLGNKTYEHYNAMGRNFDSMLSKIGAGMLMMKL